MDDFKQWENELERPAFVPPMVAALRLGEQWSATQPAPEAPRNPYTRHTDIWRVQYHQGRYWHLNLKREAGSPGGVADYTMRGAFVCAPIETWLTCGAVGLAWHGRQLAKIQSFAWDAHK